MPINQSFIGELQQEAIGTRKMLERVPFDKLDFKPHEKSMPLKSLSTHVCELPNWINFAINSHELDFAVTPYYPATYSSAEDLVKAFDGFVAKAVTSLQGCTDEQMMEQWTLRNGEQIYFTMPRVQVIRGMCLNHLYHHRGQLSVYLRLLDVALPSVYGPTADEGSM